MNSTVRETLMALHETRNDDRIFEINDVKRSFTYACQKAGITDFRFHDLRHTATTRLTDRARMHSKLQRFLANHDPDVGALYTCYK